MAEDKSVTESENKNSIASSVAGVEKKHRGIISRIWNGIFRLKRDDFEKRLQYISKEEAAVLARMKRRSQTWSRMARHHIIFSFIFEVIAVGYAIMTTRSVDLDWKMRTLRILPMFLLPALSSLTYSAFVGFTRICDRKDQKSLERLRAERQSKIDELKERTNYYTTQQLIQRYDTDPAAKAAAATVLASKLGADSGLKVYVGDETKLNVPVGRSNDAEVVPSSGLQNRKQLHTRPSSAGSTPLHHSNEETTPHSVRSEGAQTSEHSQLVVNHHNPQGSNLHDGGWISRIAALLVGDDPAQSCALICGNCHMHNGLARKEDFAYITYYCPHCHALNKPKESEERVSGSPNTSSLTKDSINTTGGPLSDSVRPSNSPVREGSGIEETEKLSPVREGSGIEEAEKLD